MELWEGVEGLILTVDWPAYFLVVQNNITSTFPTWLLCCINGIKKVVTHSLYNTFGAQRFFILSGVINISNSKF